MLGIETILLISLLAVVVFLIALYIHIMAKYRVVVPPNVADVVIDKDGKYVYTSNEERNSTGNAVYHEFPKSWPLFGKEVTRVPLDVFTVELTNITLYDKSRARFNCDVTVYLLVEDILKYAEKVDVIEELDRQLFDLTEAVARGIAATKSVQQILTDHSDIVEALKTKLKVDVVEWGLKNTNVQMLGFKDTPGTKTITNINLQREKELETSMRKEVAIRERDAIIKEAESQETAEKRVIEMEENIEKREQEKNKSVFEKEKEAVKLGFEVENIELVAHEKNVKEQKKVQGEGEHELAKGQAEAEVILTKREGEIAADVMKVQGKAKADVTKNVGEAEAGIHEKKLLAEATGREAIKDVVNLITREGMEAMTIEQAIEAEKIAKVATADAIGNAETKILVGGGDNSNSGFDVSRVLQAVKLGDTDTAAAILNKIARPNDLGLSNWNQLAGKIDDPKIQKKLKKLFETE